MTLDKFTIKAQEVVQQAVNIAEMNGQQAIEPVHILKGVTEKAKDVANFIFQKLGVNGQQIAMLVDQEIQHLPKVQGAVSPISPMKPTRCWCVPRNSHRRWATNSSVLNHFCWLCSASTLRLHAS